MKKGKGFLHYLFLLLIFLVIVTVSLFLLRIFFFPDIDNFFYKKIDYNFDNVKKLKSERIQLNKTSDLNPTIGEDFLVYGWFRLNKLPSDGERFVLFSKYDTEKKNIPGYALSIERRGKSIIPYVYFNDGSKKGRWYRFADIDIVQRVWFMVALSFSDDHYLGLHYSSEHSLSNQDIQLAGGYKFENIISPISDSDLLIGGYGQYAFNGAVGVFGVFSGKNILKDYNRLYMNFLYNREKIPDLLSDAVKYWSIDVKDDFESEDEK